LAGYFRIVHFSWMFHDRRKTTSGLGQPRVFKEYCPEWYSARDYIIDGFDKVTSKEKAVKFIDKCLKGVFHGTPKQKAA